MDAKGTPTQSTSVVAAAARAYEVARAAADTAWINDDAAWAALDADADAAHDAYVAAVSNLY